MKNLFLALFIGLLSLSVNAQVDRSAPKYDLTRPNPKTSAEINSMTRMQEGSEAWNDTEKIFYRYVNGVWIPEPTGGSGGPADNLGDHVIRQAVTTTGNWDLATLLNPLGNAYFSGSVVANDFLGIVRFSQLSSPPGVSGNGIAYFNDATDRLAVHDGLQYRDLAYHDELGSGGDFGIVASGSQDMTGVVGSNVVTTITHNLGYVPDPSRITLIYFRPNQQTATGSQYLIGNITSTTFDVITGGTGSDDLTLYWKIFGPGTVTPIVEGHVIEDNGAAVTQRANLNIVGATVTDDAANDRTTIAFTGVSDGNKVDINVSGSTWTINNGVVTGDKIANLTINGDQKLQIGSITTNKLQDGAVSQAKMQSNSVGIDEIDNSSNGVAPTVGQVPSFNGTDFTWITPAGSSATNLSTTTTPNNVTVNSDTGTDANIGAYTNTDAGVVPAGTNLIRHDPTSKYFDMALAIFDTRAELEGATLDPRTVGFSLDNASGVAPNPPNSTTLDLSSAIGARYVASANAATSYSTTGLVAGGWSKVLINAASQPTVTGATLITGSPFQSATNMYMVVYTDDGTNVEYYFLQI